MAIRMRRNSTPRKGISSAQCVESAIRATRKPTRSNAGQFCRITAEQVSQVYLITKTTGANATQIANLIGVHPRTVTTYVKRADLIQRNEYTTGNAVSDRLLIEFATAIKRGMDEFSSGRVENALVRKAVGFEYTEVKTEDIVFKTGRGKETIAAPASRVTRTTKYFPPSDAAVIFWLCNRLPDRWQNLYKQEQTGTVLLNHQHSMAADLSEKLGRTELEELRRLVAKSAGAPVEASTPDEGEDCYDKNTVQFRRTA